MTRTRPALFIALTSIAAIALAGCWASPDRLPDGTVPLRTALQDVALFLSLFPAVAVVWALKTLLVWTFRDWR